MSLPLPPTVPHCYRHPDREGGRSCTRCGRPACSDCLVQAAVGSHCLECAKAARPPVADRARLWNARQPTLVTYVLIGLNLAVFLWVLAGDPGTLTSNSLSQRQIDLGLNRRLLEFDHEWYRLVTSGFLHFGIFHIGLNMLLLFQLGQLLEPAIGRVRFGLLYGASLLAGSLGVLVVQPNSLGLHGGASGAVFGLMTAAAVGMHRRGINIFSTGIGTTLVLNVVLTFAISNISIGGHFGGAVAGAVCGYVVLAPAWRPLPRWSTYAVPALVGIAAVVASVALTI